ncbi:RNA polymerase sigma factor [Streptacidiphilus jiangxiensis]|uniref:RNA polymerase sigma-70 factor, ECF subfamily n=1 Tax=Streptacidiphilus jiangxiensis TaxID=235985 RepID=A0A1H7PN63_STRJI|nr:RNA polymerase sigma factor [Streptacidiphilus jiangxiensis]SEL36497.1 RNA polymerase sigma-70 factor, ECF subfamily [Streptacidiphilus jiangxiensis]
MPTEHPIAPPVPDPSGFAEFYEQNFAAILGFVTRRTDNVHLAADLTADIFLTALEQVESYDARRGTPAAWLYGIARNVLATHFRGSARERRAVSRIAGHRMLDEQDVAAIESRIDAARAARELTGLHAALSEPLRAVLDLVAVDGLTIREAAQALGISAATARMRLHRARKALKSVTPQAGPSLNTLLEAAS